MKCILTGAAGFIGSHLSERLLRDGWNVIGVDNFDTFYDPQVKWSNIAECMEHDNFSLVEADIRDKEAMENVFCEGADVVVHLAARAGVRPSIEQPELYADVNLNGTVVLLEAARSYGIGKFIFASSSSVYGNNKKVPFSETDNVDHPISPYAATKKAGELLCHTYSHLYDLPMTCLRFFTVYGPRQRPDLAIHKFARLILDDNPLPIFGDGSMKRDFTYIDDIIGGVMAAIDKCAGYEIYNLGESQPCSVNELVDALEKALGKKAKREFKPLQPGDVDQTFADVDKAEKKLGYQRTTQLEAGLAQFVKWLNEKE